MRILPGDILLRKEKEGRTVWIKHSVVVFHAELSEDYTRLSRSRYKKTLPLSQQKFNILPDNGNAWRWARIDGAFYYDLKRIPNRAPKHYRDCLPPEHELLKAAESVEVSTRAELAERIRGEIVEMVDEFMSNSDAWYYRYDSEPTFNEKKSKQLAESLAWLNMMSAFVETKRYKKIGIKRLEDFYQHCVDIISAKELEGLRISTARSLRKKLYYYPPVSTEAQRKYVISGLYGNKNSLKVGKFELVDKSTGEVMPFDIHQAIMFNLYMNPGGSEKQDLIELWDEYKTDLADFTNEQPISYRTFCHHCTRFDNQLLMAKARHGADYYNKHYLTFVPSQELKFAHSLFAADGSATVAYKYYDSEGACKRMNLYVILVSDVSSRYIAGWAAAREGFHNETDQMVERAVKMAVVEGGKLTMHEIVTDNHKAFTGSATKELLGNAFKKVRTIKPHNSQANPAETQFRLFKKTLKKFNNFLRSSWSAGINSQANPDFIPNNEMLPTYEEALVQIGEIINKYNNKPLRDGSTPAKRFENKHPDCQPMDARKLRLLFGKKTKEHIARYRGFIDVKTGGVLFRYEIKDYNNGAAKKIAEATGYTPDPEVKIIFDKHGADIYTLSNDYIMSCKPAPLTVQSQAEATDETNYALGHHEKRKRKQLDAAESFEEQAVGAIDALSKGMAEAYNIAITDKNFSKESYNEGMEAELNDNTVKNNQSTRRIDRDFDEDEWIDIDN